MKTSRRWRVAFKRALLVVSTLLAMTPAIWAADYASIAYGGEGAWGWAVRNSQAAADKAALDGCNESAPKNDCQVELLKAVARAKGITRVGISGSATSVAEARQQALKECGRPDCKIVDVFAKPGFIAYAMPKDGNGAIFVAWQYKNSGQADKDAVQGCEENAGSPCRLIYSGAIRGRMKTAAPAPAPKPPAPAAAASCRPNTSVIRCSSQCTNGNCIITYENGCRIRVQVNAVYDPFTNQWKYPAPSC